MVVVYKVASAKNGEYFVGIDEAKRQIIVTHRARSVPGQDAVKVESHPWECEGKMLTLALGITRAHALAGQKHLEGVMNRAASIANKIIGRDSVLSSKEHDAPADASIDADGHEIGSTQWKPGPKIKHNNHLQIRNGDLYGVRSHICGGSQLFGVLIDFDPLLPILMKYGNYKHVALHAKQVWDSCGRYIPGMEFHVELLALPVHPEIIEELNCCIDCSVRIAYFRGFLEDFRQRHPEVKIEPYQLLDLDIDGAGQKKPSQAGS